MFLVGVEAVVQWWDILPHISGHVGQTNIDLQVIIRFYFWAQLIWVYSDQQVCLIAHTEGDASSIILEVMHRQHTRSVSVHFISVVKNRGFNI